MEQVKTRIIFPGMWCSSWGYELSTTISILFKCLIFKGTRIITETCTHVKRQEHTWSVKNSCCLVEWNSVLIVHGFQEAEMLTVHAVMLFFFTLYSCPGLLCRVDDTFRQMDWIFRKRPGLEPCWTTPSIFNASCWLFWTTMGSAGLRGEGDRASWNRQCLLFINWCFSEENHIILP